MNIYPRPILTIFEICQFILTPKPFEYFSKNQKICFLDEWAMITQFWKEGKKIGYILD